MPPNHKLFKIGLRRYIGRIFRRRIFAVELPPNTLFTPLTRYTRFVHLTSTNSYPLCQRNASKADGFITINLHYFLPVKLVDY